MCKSFDYMKKISGSTVLYVILVLASLVAQSKADWTLTSFGYNSPFWTYQGGLTGSFPSFTLHGTTGPGGWAYTTYTNYFAEDAFMSFTTAFTPGMQTGNETGGYVLNDVYTPMPAGSTNVHIRGGDVFGWYVYDDFTGSTMGSLSVSAQTVPEPSTYALLLLSGVASILAFKRRKS
jgi:hypothetical protein